MLKWTSFLLPLLLVVTGCSRVEMAGESTDLAPRKDWRVETPLLGATENASHLAPLKEGASAQWTCGLRSRFAFAVEIPEDQENPVMVTYRYPEQPVGVKVSCEVSPDSTNGQDGSWEIIGTQTPNTLLQKFTVEPDSTKWVRLSFVPTEDFENTEDVQIDQVGLYDLDPNARNDYWVVLGASIQAQSIRQDVFHQMVQEKYPGYDPVIFNEAIGGWWTHDLLDALPGFLEEHPHASYMPIHIGGNNVSANRPYPDGADQIRQDVEQILTMIQENGKQPILSRLSFRSYKASGDRGTVPPEENGSGPYVKNTYDPLIREYCPLFYDFEQGRGKVDPYNWFKFRPQELSRDGIHVNETGAESWNRIWVEQAGEVIYGK